MENSELEETNETSPQAIGKVKVNSFTDESEKDWEKLSMQSATQNVDSGDVEFSKEQIDLLDNVTSQPIGILEKDVFTIQSENHKKQYGELKIDNISNDGPLFDNKQDKVSNKIDEVIDIKSSNQEGTKYNVARTSQLTQSIGNNGDLQCGFHHENLETSIVPSDLLQKEHENDFMKSEIQVDITEQECFGDNVGNSGDFEHIESSNQEGTKYNVARTSQLTQSIGNNGDLQCGFHRENLETSIVPSDLLQKEHENDFMKSEIQVDITEQEYFGDNVGNNGDFEHKSQEVSLDNNFGWRSLATKENDSKSIESAQMNQKTENALEDYSEPEVRGSEVCSTEVGCSTPMHTLDTNPEAPRVVEKAISIRNFVREKSIIAVSIMMRHLSGKRDECGMGNSTNTAKDASDLSRGSETREVSEKTTEKTTWNPLNYIKISSDADAENKIVQRDETVTEYPPLPMAMRGMILVYTRLGCQECKEVRKFLYMKRLRYVEINIDVYPSRKMELEKNSGSTSVPKVFFNEILIGDLSTLKSLNESGKLNEKIDYLISETPSFECPVPPLSGEDDVSSSGALDEMALIVRKMKEYITVKDRYYKMRKFTHCFLGYEAVDFLSEDQYLERKEAIEFARKLASKLFFQHVLDENLFEDGNHLYRFLDDDPAVASLCYNIPRGIITVKPKPMTEIASRLRLLSYAMFEAYASEDGRHVDYRSMHGSEEFARYLRIIEELQRGEIWNLSREEKLAFFINLYNMMTIHAILVWGHPSGALERRKLFGDFKYVIGGFTYSLSAIQNGILRGNQRPPYTFMKSFSAKDKRLRVALPFPEPLIHFALVYGTRSGPALRCYSPGDIDKELVDATRNFLRSGGLLIDFTAKVAYASKILKWFSSDFGKNEVEVLKHVSNYLDPNDSELLFDLLATSELKVIYQPYDWGLNC